MKIKKLLAVILSVVFIASAFTACNNNATSSNSKVEESKPDYLDIDGDGDFDDSPKELYKDESAVELNTTTSKMKISRKKIVLSDDVIKQASVFFQGDTYEAGDKIDLSTVKYSESEKEAFDKFCFAISAFNYRELDIEKHIINVVKPVAYSFSYDDDYIYVEAKTK